MLGIHSLSNNLAAVCNKITYRLMGSWSFFSVYVCVSVHRMDPCTECRPCPFFVPKQDTDPSLLTSRCITHPSHDPDIFNFDLTPVHLMPSWFNVNFISDNRPLNVNRLHNTSVLIPNARNHSASKNNLIVTEYFLFVSVTEIDSHSVLWVKYVVLWSVGTKKVFGIFYQILTQRKNLRLLTSIM